MGSYRISIEIQSFEALKWVLIGDQMEICGRRMTIGVFENRRSEREREWETNNDLFMNSYF